MFSKKFKLIGTAIGLVAVLALVLAVPGVTQQAQLPTRNQIVSGLGQLLSATLTASEGDILAVEDADFFSGPVVTWGYIPLHASSRSAQLLRAWVEKEEPFGDSLNIGAFYLENDAPSCPPGYDLLKAGTYQLKVTKDLKLIAVDAMGSEFTVGRVSVERPGSSSNDRTLIPPLVKVFLLLCAVSDVQVCITRTRCTSPPGGIGPPDCIEEQICVGC